MKNIIFLVMQYKSIIRITLATAFILLLPLVAMQFTNEVDWDLADFAVAGVLLLGAGCTYELVTRMSSNIAYRAAVAIAIGIVFLLIWVELAVGIFGSPFAGS